MTKENTKTILITGGTRGIGKATALLAASRGWSMVLNYHSHHSSAQETADQVQQLGGKAHIV